MTEFRELKWLFLVLALFSILQSCAGTKSRLSPQRPVQEPAQTAASARQHVHAGEYQSAINDYSAEYRSRPHDQALVKEYVRSLEDIKAVADKASDKKAFASAGKAYNVLLKNYSCFKGFAQMLSFDRADLNTKRSQCKQLLSTQGFQEYREGNLSEAIALWQSLLSIDPNDADIKAAVRTATLQQKNLQEKAARR